MSEKNKDATMENENGEDTSTDSSTEKKQGEDGGSSSEADAKNQTTDFSKFPLDKHPRWAEREADWNKRFEQQQKDFDAKLAEVKGAGQAEKKINENTAIPKWFGGNQQQWDEYVSWHNDGIEKAEARALERFTGSQTAEKKAVADANAWFEESIKNIESEAGKAIDRNALLKVVVDNELIDSKGRWNYKAGWQILKGQGGNAAANSVEDRKRLAADTGKDGGHADAGTRGAKTADDFRKPGARPW